MRWDEKAKDAVGRKIQLHLAIRDGKNPEIPVHHSKFSTIASLDLVGLALKVRYFAFTIARDPL